MSNRATTKSRQQQHASAEPAREQPRREVAGPASGIMALQRAAGNQAVSTLLRTATVRQTSDSNGVASRGLGLNIDGADDPAEQEATNVAHQIMNSPASTIPPKRQHVAPPTPAAPNRLPARGPGQPLPESERAFFEPRFGHNLSQVRIHTDEPAIKSADALNASAYVMGSHVVFGQGQYQPGSASGRQLLAHELTHVLQQSKNGDPLPAHDPGGQQAIVTRDMSAAPMIQRKQRNPDIAKDNRYTWYVDIGGKDKAFAMQIGEFPDFHKGRIAIRFASQRPGMTLPPTNERTMLLAISPSASLAPAIVSETEEETPDGNGYQKTIQLTLNSADQDALTVGIAFLYHAGRQKVPFEDEKSFGGSAWKNVHLESGAVIATDGLHDLSANFSAVHPKGSLFAPGTQWFRHPGLGMGRLLPGNKFVPLPRQDVFTEALESVGKELIRTGIHLIPVVGSLVMIGEALVGKDIWGRKLSTTERAILGAGALLAEIGPLIRVGKTAAAASRLSRVASISRTQALRMVVMSRAMTASESEALAQMSTKIKAGKALNAAEQKLANRIMGKMTERLRVKAIRAEVEAATGTASQSGRFTNLNKSISTDEQRIGSALAKDLKSDVVRPPDLPTTTRNSGMKNPDYILDDVAAEALSPQTGNLERLLNNIVDKHRQAGQVVVDLTHTSVSTAEFLGQVGRLWKRPNFGDVSRIIVVDGERVAAQVLAPASSSLAPTIIRGAASVTSRSTRDSESEEKTDVPQPKSQAPSDSKQKKEAAQSESRSPDISGHGMQTWYVNIGGDEKAFAIQIGKQPDFQPDNYSIRFASLRQAFTNPAESERTLALPVPVGSVLKPQLTEQSMAGGLKKMLHIKLNPSSGEAPEVRVAIAMEAHRIYLYAQAGERWIKLDFPRAQ